VPDVLARELADPRNARHARSGDPGRSRNRVLAKLGDTSEQVWGPLGRAGGLAVRLSRLGPTPGRGNVPDTRATRSAASRARGVPLDRRHDLWRHWPKTSEPESRRAVSCHRTGRIRRRSRRYGGTPTAQREGCRRSTTGGGNGSDRPSATKRTAQTSSVASGRTADKPRGHVRGAHSRAVPRRSCCLSSDLPCPAFSRPSCHLWVARPEGASRP
jgi:hypothetical protein